MDFSSQSESVETSPPPRPPVCLTLEELAENLEYLAEDEYAFTLPTYDVPDSDTGVPQHLSIEENLSVTISVPPAPQTSATPNTWSPALPDNNLTSTSTNQLNPAPSTSTTNSSTANPNRNPNSNSNPNLRRLGPGPRRVRTQTLITRPAERLARNDLESLIPPHLRHQAGRGHGTTNHAVFRGAAQYIRWLERRVRKLETEEEAEKEEDARGNDRPDNDHAHAQT